MSGVLICSKQLVNEINEYFFLFFNLKCYIIDEKLFRYKKIESKNPLIPLNPLIEK